MTLQWLLNWSTLIFVTPFAVALLYLGLMTLSGIGLGDGDADADGGHDVGADHDADVDADHDMDGEHDSEGEHDSDGEGHSALGTALAWLGVGRVPISILVIVMLLVWGAAGFVADVFMRPASGWEAARVALPVAFIASVFMTRVVVLFMGRFVPLNESYARRKEHLVGSFGEAIYGIDETFGMAGVRDVSGDLHQVSCRVAAGVGGIHKGERVKLIAYDAKNSVFFVAKCG